MAVSGEGTVVFVCALIHRVLVLCVCDLRFSPGAHPNNN